MNFYNVDESGPASVKLVPQFRDQRLADVWDQGGGSARKNTAPFALTLVLFILLLCLCIVSVAGCLSIGTNLPQQVANHWLSSVLAAIAIHACIFELLKVFLLAVYFAFCLNKLLL